MSEWISKGAPAVGVHRTASHYSEMNLRMARYQHWNGRHWGLIGHTPDEAVSFADKKTEYLPLAWRGIQGESFEEHRHRL